MRCIQNIDGIEENAVQNRFTAYLKVSLEHNTARYAARLRQKRLLEVFFDESEWLYGEFIAEDFFEQLFADEIGDTRLQQALACLRDQERSILFLHILHARPLKLIASDLTMPYPTVKSIYHRSLEKLRKGLLEGEF